MASLMYNTLFETPYNDELMRRVRDNALRKEHYNPTEPQHISYNTYPSVNGSGRSSAVMSGGAMGHGRYGGVRGDPRSLGLDYDPRYLRSGSTINFPVIQFDNMMANPASGGVRMDGYFYHDNFNPYYNRVVSANFGTARPSFNRNAQYEQGGSKIGNFFKRVGHALAPVGRAVMPVVKEVGTDLLKDAIKGAIVGAGGKRRGRPRKVVGVGRFEGSGHPSGLPIHPNDLYMGTGRKTGGVSKAQQEAFKAQERRNTAETIWNDLIHAKLPPNRVYRPDDKNRDISRIMNLLKSSSEEEVRNVIETLANMENPTGGNARTFFRKVGNTLKKVGKAVAPVAVPILKEVGKDLLKGAIMGAVVGAGVKKRGRPKGSGGKRSNVNKEGEPKMCAFLAKECGAKPTRAGRPKGAKNKAKTTGGVGASVDSAGILSVTPNPPPELQVVGGKSNIGRKIKNTFKKVGKFLAPAVPVLKEIGKEVFNEVKPILIQEGKKQLKEGIKGAISGSGTKKGQVRKTARKAYEGVKKPNARAEIVKKVMAEKGMKMIEASKYVKEHGLYKK
jgi:hypothetical protein